VAHATTAVGENKVGTATDMRGGGVAETGGEKKKKFIKDFFFPLCATCHRRAHQAPPSLAPTPPPPPCALSQLHNGCFEVRGACGEQAWARAACGRTRSPTPAQAFLPVPVWVPLAVRRPPHPTQAPSSPLHHATLRPAPARMRTWTPSDQECERCKVTQGVCGAQRWDHRFRPAIFLGGKLQRLGNPEAKLGVAFMRCHLLLTLAGLAVASASYPTTSPCAISSPPPALGHALLPLFALNASYTNLNHGSYGAVPRCVLEAAYQWALRCVRTWCDSCHCAVTLVAMSYSGSLLAGVGRRCGGIL
jgi:hypothetical protein